MRGARRMAAVIRRLPVVELTVEQVDASSDLSALLAAEHDHLAGFQNPTDALSFGGARALLRTVLGSRLGVDPADVVLRRLPDGRLVLADSQPGLEFSVSHANPWVAVALATSRVGVDVQPVLLGDESEESEDFRRRAFTQREASYLSSLAPVARRQEFARLWSRKESLVKAGGASGMSRAGALEVLGRPASRRVRYASWWIYDTSDHPNRYALSVTSDQPVRIIRQH